MMMMKAMMMVKMIWTSVLLLLLLFIKHFGLGYGLCNLNLGDILLYSALVYLLCLAFFEYFESMLATSRLQVDMTLLSVRSLSPGQGVEYAKKQVETGFNYKN